MPEFTVARPSYAADINEQPWAPLLVEKEQIDLEVERLLDEGASGDDRSSSFVHSRATDGVPSLTPVTEVSVNVLKPGESTTPRRGNYSLLETTISGSGTVHAGKTFEVEKHDVWTVPSMQAYHRTNTGSTPWIWLTYSNSAILRRTGSYWDETLPAGATDVAKRPIVSTSEEVNEKYSRINAPIHMLPTTGAELRAYEYLTDILPVANPALHWAWKDMAPHLKIREGDNNDPDKRGIWLMYNPATERRQGTTPNHFATYGGAAPGSTPYAGKRGHFHISASINYHIRGYGYSVVGGDRVDWKEGDLLFSAPSWVEHAHYHGEDGWNVLTVQDHPLHISMGSLLWQENPDDPILSLGNEEGQKGYVGPRKAGD